MPKRKEVTSLLLKDSPPKSFPIIELFGDIDSGKGVVGDAVARKIRGVCLKFPVFNAPKSASGIALLTVLTQNPQLLEDNPHWWAHMFIANLWENQDKIMAYQQLGPVVLVNWTSAVRSYFKTLTQSQSSIGTGLVHGLLKTDFEFMIRGVSKNYPGNLPINFSPSFKIRLGLHLSRYFRCQHFTIKDKGNSTTNINTTAQQIVDSILSKRPDLKEKYFSYPNGYF